MLSKLELGKQLKELFGAGRSAVSEAINERFAFMLELQPGGLMLDLKAEYKPEPLPFDDETTEPEPEYRSSAD